MDTALLSCADADSLTVLHVADGVRLCIFQRDEGDDQVALGLGCEGLVLCGHILEEGVVVELDLVAALLEGDAEHLFPLDRLRLVVGVYLDHVIGTLALVFQDFDSLGRIVGSNHTVAHLALQQLGGSGVAGVAESHEVTVARHTVGTTGAGVGTGDRTLVEILDVVHEVDLLQCVAERQTYGSTSRTHVLKRSCGGQASGSLQFLHQLPGVEGVEEIDVAGTAIDHFDGELALGHKDA